MIKIFLSTVCLLFSLCVAAASPAAQSTGPQITPQVAAAALADSARVSAIPFKQESTLSWGMLFKVFFIALVLLAMAVGALYAVKRYLYGQTMVAGGQQHNIQILEAKRLTPKTMIMMLQVGQKRFLISQSGDNVVLLDKTDAEENKT